MAGGFEVGSGTIESFWVETCACQEPSVLIFLAWVSKFLVADEDFCFVTWDFGRGWDTC